MDTDRFMAMATGVDLTRMVSAQLRYYTWYDTRQNKDFCRVDVSTDYGHSWQTLESYSGGGTSWALHTSSLDDFRGCPDVRIRFLLHAERTGQSREGWYVDDVTIDGQQQPRHDAGAARIFSPTGNVAQFDSIFPKGQYANFGNQVDTVWAYMSFSGGIPYFYYRDSARIILPVAASCTVNFRPVRATSAGDFNTKAWTWFAADAYGANDSVFGEFHVSQNISDVGLGRIVAPAGLMQPSWFRPKVWIKNFGTTPENLQVLCRIFLGETLYAASDSLWLGPGDSTLLAFAPWTPPQGSYVAWFKTVDANDQVPDNDTARIGFTVLPFDHDVGVSAIENPGDSCLPVSIWPQVIVYNYGRYHENFYTRFMILDSLSNPVYDRQVLTTDLGENQPKLVTFPLWNASAGYYLVRCFTGLGGDLNPGNDTVTQRLAVCSPIPAHDVGVTEIVSPVDSCGAGPITPRARVYNSGLNLETFNVHFVIRNGLQVIVYDQQVEIPNLAVDEERLATFPYWPAGAGLYELESYTDLATDLDHTNDTLDDEVIVTDTGTVGQGGVTGWFRRCPMPPGPKAKRVKDGAGLAFVDDTAAGTIYGLKGNNTLEFYAYGLVSDTWTSRESMPRLGTSGKRKAVKKGASMAGCGGKVYAVKGNNTLEFWRYDPHAEGASKWISRADVPVGARRVKEGSGLAPVRIGETDYLYFLKGSRTFEFYRYNTQANTWETRASAPIGFSGKEFKNGSCLAYDGLKTIYALKGTYNEFFAYQVDSDKWRTLANLPLVGVGGRKKKLKDGAGIAGLNPESVYVQKGGNTFEWWCYAVESSRWVQNEDYLTGAGKRVKGGGSLLAVPELRRLYSLKGNNTFEFAMYAVGDTLAFFARNRPAGQTMSLPRRDRLGDLLVYPNPLRGPGFIDYCLTAPARVTLRVYDAAGRMVRKLNVGPQPAGRHLTTVNIRGLPAGVYLLQVEAGSRTLTRKLVLEP
jgi:hypothetical protein